MCPTCRTCVRFSCQFKIRWLVGSFYSTPSVAAFCCWCLITMRAVLVDTICTWDGALFMYLDSPWHDKSNLWQEWHPMRYCLLRSVIDANCMLISRLGQCFVLNSWTCCAMVYWKQYIELTILDSGVDVVFDRPTNLKSVMFRDNDI